MKILKNILLKNISKLNDYLNSKFKGYSDYELSMMFLCNAYMTTFNWLILFDMFKMGGHFYEGVITCSIITILSIYWFRRMAKKGQFRAF